jgi:hypothetical protein
MALDSTVNDEAGAPEGFSAPRGCRLDDDIEVVELEGRTLGWNLARRKVQQDYDGDDNLRPPGWHMHGPLPSGFVTPRGCPACDAAAVSPTPTE